jgi:hypothetical protein
LPDDIFIFKPKFQFGLILGGLGMQKVGILVYYMEYIGAIWFNTWPFVNLAAIWWYIFPRFGTLCHEKSVSPGR